MVPRAALLRALREAGYKFKRQGKRVSIWKRPNSVDRISLPRKGDFDPVYVERLLRRAGSSEDRIKDLLGE